MATATGESYCVHAGVMFQGTQLSPVGAGQTSPRLDPRVQKELEHNGATPPQAGPPSGDSEGLTETEGPGCPRQSPLALASAQRVLHTVRLLTSPHGAALRNACPARIPVSLPNCRKEGGEGARWTPQAAQGPASRVTDRLPKSGAWAWRPVATRLVSCAISSPVLPSGL